MPWPYPFGETVQVLTAPARPKYGQPTPAPTVKATYTNCAVAPGDARGEDTFQRDTVEVALTVFLPPGADVTAVDKITVRGETWDVVGEPQPTPSPLTGWDPGVPVALRRSTG